MYPLFEVSFSSVIITCADSLVHAASKKFMASLEPIILASSQKPLVNPNTHRTIVDILADLAYHFGNEKGCEPLVDMWKKVKMPQEPDNVSWLVQIFSSGFVAYTFRGGHFLMIIKSLPPKLNTQPTCSTDRITSSLIMVRMEVVGMLRLYRTIPDREEEDMGICLIIVKI